MVYEDPFQRLLQAAEQYSESICNDWHAEICHQPYNLRLIAKLSNSEHDSLSLPSMRNIVDFSSTLLDLDVQGCVFLSALKFKTWNELLF